MASDLNENIECELRFGHCEGFTDCSFVSINNNLKLMTCGVDSEVRVWQIDEQNDGQNDDNIESFPISDQSYAIVCNSSNFFIACDSNCVKSYSLADGENETTVCRFTTNATHLDISTDGNLLVASAADFTFKLINLETNSQKVFEGHDAPILSISLDPKHKYIASSSCDSSVKIWNAENQNCVHFWTNCYPKSNDFENSETLARISWQPIDGQLIAIPKVDRIDVYQRESWDLVKTYKHDKLSQISIVTHSFDGNFLSAATNSGTVMVWETKTTNSEPIATFFHNKSIKITSLKWNPKVSKQLCFCDINGQFGILNIKTSFSKTENKGFELSFTQQEMNEMFAELSDDDFGIESNEIRVENEKNKTDFELPKIEFNPNFGKTVSKLIKTVNEVNDEDNNEEDNEEDNEFDIGAIKSQYESQIFGNKNDLEKVEVRENSRESSRSVSRMSAHIEPEPEDPPPLRQEPFQSGSTPIHFKQRYMVWNSVGIVRCYDTENENSIDVEFHDVTYHHSIHLPNVHNYTIADLSTDSLVLATSGDETSGSSKFFCMLFNTWDATKEWQTEMPKDEYIEAITCGSGFIAITTDKRFVRIFTTGGIQTNIFSIPGRVLCISSHEQFLMIIYHSASGMPEEQSLSMYVLKVDHKPVTKHPVPNPISVSLSPKSQLSWAGFTDEGTPCVVDYDGVVRLLKTIIGNSWIPIASTKEHTKGKSDNYFIIGLSEIQSQIRCIFCKGSRYPATIPKPTLTLLPLQIPLCEMFTTKGKHEEEQIRNKMLASLLKKLSKDGFDVESPLEECNRSIINSLIKLFALALGADRESLAMEIAHLMPNQRAIEGAIKYAERQRHRSLAQKLSEIAQQKLEEELNDDLDDECEDIYQTTHMNTNRMIANNNELQETNDLQLKPKSLRKEPEVTENSNNGFQSSDNESDAETKVLTTKRCITSKTDEDVNSDDSLSLKPKEVKKVTHNRGNPFKVSDNGVKRKNNKRKKGSDYSEDETDDEEKDNSGFKRFYDEMRDIIKDDNSDAEDEEDLIKIAKQQFKELDSNEKKNWAQEKTNKRKAKCDKSKPNGSKITKFFKRN